MIYEHLLPADRDYMIKPLFFDYQVPEGTTMASACKADGHLRSELLAYAARYCTIKITVTENAALIPTFEDISIATSIELMIPHSSALRRKPNLKQLRENIQNLVAIMSKCPLLRRLSIEFCCGQLGCPGAAVHRRCEYWCTTSSASTCNESGRLTNKYRRYVLNTLDTAYVPIVEYLLAPFVDLPALGKSARIKHLRGLESSRDWPFDHKYMFNLFVTLENWLVGHRSASFAELRSQPDEMFRAYSQRREEEIGTIGKRSLEELLGSGF